MRNPQGVRSTVPRTCHVVDRGFLVSEKKVCDVERLPKSRLARCSGDFFIFRQ